MLKRLLSFFRNEYVFSIFAKVFSIILSLGHSVLMARFLGAELKGTSSYISSIASIGAIIITFGMHQAYPYLRKQMGKDTIYNDYLTTIICLFSVYLFISLIIISFISSIEIKAAILLIPIFGYAKVVSYVCIIESPNRRNRIWTILSAVDVLFVGALFLYAEKNVFWAIAILLLVEALKCIIYTIVLKPKLIFSRRIFIYLKNLFKLGFFPMIALLMTTLNYRIDVLMLRGFDHITEAQIGIYSIGIHVAEKIVLIPDTLKGVMVSKLAKGADENEVAKVSRLCFWASSLLCVLFVLVGDWGIKFLYGEEYNGAYLVMIICAFGALAIGYFKLIAQYNIVNKKQIRNVILLTIAIVVDVVFNLLLIPKYGINGAAFATALGNFACGLTFVIWFSSRHKIPIYKMFFLQKNDLSFIKALIVNDNKK